RASARVPEGAAGPSANNVNVKLGPDADGRVGRLEIKDRQGGSLGALTRAASGFAIRPGIAGAVGARFAAVPITISPQLQARDQGFVRQVHTAQNVGRQIFTERRDFRRANPGVINPNAPRRQGGQLQPGQGRPGQPGQPQPGQNRPGQPGQQPPGAPNNRQGQQQPQPGQPRPGQNAQPRRGQNALPAPPGQPGSPPRPGQNGLPVPPGQPGAPPRPGQNTLPATPGQPGTPPRPGQNALPPTPGQPGTLPRPG